MSPMNKVICFSVLTILLSSCNTATRKGKFTQKQSNTAEMELQTNKIYVTSLMYFKSGEEEKFKEYKTKVDTIFAKHNGYVTKKIKPLRLLKGDIELPDEIHFGHFENMQSLLAAGEDKDYRHLIETLRTPSLEKLVIILSKSANFDVKLETGDETKFYGITILNYKKEAGSEKIFNEYLTKTCAVMPEFGTHFEHFLIPFQVKGDFEKPDKVHLFYLDTREGFQKIGTDPRMEELIPLRDKSVEKAILILGKVI